ncbi:MAG: metallophosphoesterase family protein [Bacteroidales bacterium]|nr:metallophosphoesterase family protein [Bacteroidales bacterium]
MRKIGLLSDTHSYYHPKIESFFSEVDEIWHAGDIGDPEILTRLKQFKPCIAVIGNIDGNELRLVLKEKEIFFCEDVKVMITHIGGYPGRYHSGIKQLLLKENIKLFISGHSHILKVMNDQSLNLLHMNPGAAGIQGMHHRITMLRFKIDKDRIEDLEVFDAARNRD